MIIGNPEVVNPFDAFATGWEFSQSLVTPPPPGFSPADDPTILNLEITCVACAPLAGPAPLGTIRFRVEGVAALVRPIQYIGRAFEGDTPVANIGDTFAPAAVPEPASVALFGLGLGLIASRRWLGRR